jgi:hypothetical protein
MRNKHIHLKWKCCGFYVLVAVPNAIMVECLEWLYSNAAVDDRSEENVYA